MKEKPQGKSPRANGGSVQRLVRATALWDVVIFEKATRRIDAIIGKRMRRYDGNGSGRNTADLRAQTGLERVNDHFDVRIVKADKWKKGDVLP